MIGAVIQARTHSESFPGKILHIFSGRSVLEIITVNALQAEQLHKVVVTMPMADRPTSHGSTLRTAILPQDLSYNHKKPVYHFDIKGDDVLGRIYWAAAENNFDHIVRIRGNCPLIPTWLINDVIYNYLSEGMNCTGNGLIIDSNSVVLNCNGNLIKGYWDGHTNNIGILIKDRIRVSIKNFRF